MPARTRLPFRILLMAIAVMAVITTTSPWTAEPTSAATAVKFNEIESSSGGLDWVEIFNTTAAPIDLAGYIVKDSGASVSLPAGSIVPASGYLVLEETVHFSFGLGAADSFSLFEPDNSTLVDSHTWGPSHATTTFGRCPNGTGAFTTTTSVTKGAANDCSIQVKVNEIESDLGTPGDWAELFNMGTTQVDLSGYVVKDGGASATLPAGTLIAAGGYLALDQGVHFPFGLGGADSFGLYEPGGTVLIDSHSWAAHATDTYGRCPNGTGPFGQTASTKGAANACAVADTVKINEVESSDDSGPDWIELFNLGPASANLSGHVLKDNNDASVYTFPAGTTLPAGAFLVVEEGAGGLTFGLGGADSARLFSPATATLLDSFSWTTHAATTYGRCPDGTGVFITVTAITKGTANNCVGQGPAAPWPGGQTVQTADAGGVFGQNMSGLIQEPSGTSAPGVLWAVRNGGFEAMFRLLWDGTKWAPDPDNGWALGKQLRYSDGTGQPDSESITFAASPAGGMYVATERNNAVSSVSRPAILRFDQTAAGTSLSAINDWNLTADLPVLGPNLGLEAITWIPDSFLTSKGFFDQSKNHTYNPGEYPNHVAGGLFFVGVEANGLIYAYALNPDNSFTRIATIPSGFTGVMALEFDREQQVLWAVCDNTCNGRSALLQVNAQGAFAVTNVFERPTGMPNLNNEGFAFGTQAECVNNRKPAYWSDDGGTPVSDGFAIRAGTINCAIGPDDDGDGYTNAQETGSAGTPPGNTQGSNPAVAASTPERCDGIDNDLNEGVDEGFPDADTDGIKDCVDPQNDTDTDTDGIRDEIDNCDRAANPGQQDSDNDGKGNACDADGLLPAACAGMTIDAVFVGSNANETMNGTQFNDLILAKGGNNTVNGKGGNDCIQAGEGNDKVTTTDGNDVIDAGGGNNNVNAGGGNNKVIAGGANDQIDTGNGDDNIEAGGGNNNIKAGDGTNSVTSGAGNDSITTGADNDTINAGGGNNNINAGDGTNSITTGNGNDSVSTGNGADTVNAGGGNNNINTGAGNDNITTGAGNDSVDCGANSDTAHVGGGNNNNAGGRCESFGP